MEQEFIDEAKGYESLGPQYFVARKIAADLMAKFEAEHFKPLIEKFTDEFRAALWPAVEDYLLSDTECNLQGTIWRRLDDTVKALLSGDKWAVERYALGSRYDAAAVRAAIAAHIPVELQQARVLDLEAELAEVKANLESERDMNRRRYS
jgi:hypothetical protein